MNAAIDILTPSETAVAAGVSLSQVHRIIDEKILPKRLVAGASGARGFHIDACIPIAFYFDTANTLTKVARVQTIRTAAAHCSTWSDWEECVVEDHAVSVRFAGWFARVRDHLKSLLEAREMVVEDPEILGGTPVIKGTRVPVHQIGALYDSGTPTDHILRSYPSLKAWQVELASLYVRAVPRRGRPKRALTSSLKPASVTKKRLRRSSIGD